MLKEAVAHYHKLLEDFDLAESSRLALDEGLEDAKLIFGGRRLSPYLRPHFVWSRIGGASFPFAKPSGRLCKR